MFGEESVPKIFRGEKLFVAVDGKKANINLKNLVIYFYIIFTNFYYYYCYYLNIGSNLRR